VPLYKQELDYFKDIAGKIELNRCPYCNVGMTIDTECIRRCRKCGYKEDGNIPFKAKLKFRIYQEVNSKDCIVTAFEPNDKISFKKSFQDIFTAERYVDRVKVICLPF
jgi:hypothetical protein